MQIEQEFSGFLVGCHYKKGRRGVEWPIEHSEWGGDTKIVRRAENIGVRKLYCYIYNPLNSNSEGFDEQYDYKRLPSSLLTNSEKIYGEGLIENFEYYDDGWSYIILKNFIEYPNYVPIEKVSNLHNRINTLNRKDGINKTVKQRIRLGLPLTKMECKQITKLSV
jgi:hypothetical protein